MRMFLAKLLIGRSAVIANVNIQFMEANTHDGRCANLINCTRGTVTGKSGWIAIGSFALAYHTNSFAKIAPKPITQEFTRGEYHRLKPSAYQMTDEMIEELKRLEG